MENTATFWRNLAIVLSLAVLLGGCGNSSSTSVPATATVFYAHSIAFGSNSTIKAWGYNGFGQLGFTPNQTTNGTPLTVPGLPKIKGFSTGAVHSVAFGNNSTVWAWGWNAYRQLGTDTGSTTFSSVPLQVPVHGVVAVSAGGFHTLALSGDGTVWSWGLNSLGQLGDGTTAYGSNSVRKDPGQVIDAATGAPLASA